MQKRKQMDEKHDTKWDLLVGKVHNSLTDEEEKQFREIEQSEETKNALKQIRRLYTRSQSSFLIHQIDKAKNWEYIQYKISSRARLVKLISPFSKYAAIFLLASIIGAVIYKSIHKDFNPLTYNRIEMEWGQMSKLTLSDGTKVWLNAGTKLEYPTTFNSKERKVRLNGEAQFKVSHNKDIPFEVVTKTGVIKVHGTTFNVASYDDDPEMVVTLIEGKVSIENKKGDQLAVLNPSEQISVSKQSGEAKLKMVDTQFYSSWINGKILLQETKLADLATLLRRWYNVDIHIVGEKTGELRISGTIIKDKPLDPFLKVLAGMYGIKYEIKSNRDKKDEITISKNEPPMVN